MIYKVNDIVYLKFFLFHTKFKEVHFRGKNTKLWLEHLGQYKFKKKLTISMDVIYSTYCECMKRAYQI